MFPFYFVVGNSLCMVLSYAMWQPFALYISLFQASHYSWKQLVLFFSLFCEVMPFIKAIDLLQCLNDPGPHTHTSQLYRLKINAQTIRGREIRGEGEAPGLGPPSRRVDPGRKRHIGHVYMHPGCPVSALGCLRVQLFTGVFQCLWLSLSGAINKPVNRVLAER